VRRAAVFATSVPAQISRTPSLSQHSIKDQISAAATPYAAMLAVDRHIVQFDGVLLLFMSGEQTLPSGGTWSAMRQLY